MRILRQIQEQVKAAIGIDLETVNGSPLVRALKERMAKCGLADEAAYASLLETSPKELEELIELIVVSETWFFRDEKPFAYLQKFVLEEWLPSRSSAPIKFLSLPCSTGEEPYTIAMALLDIGIVPEQLRIEAVDISRHVLEKARRGIYHRNSFRSRDISFRDRYFRLTDEGYILDEKVRRCVAFNQGNILAPGFASGKGPYDAVFFRNLLIYLAPAQQDEAMAVIDKLLVPSGILFVGHAESFQAINRGYSPVRYPFGFAYRKPSQCGELKPLASLETSQLRKHTPKAIGSAVPPNPNLSRMARQPLPDSMATPDLLDLAFAMADKGRTEEARKLCEAALASRPPKADAYYLLGLLLETQGRAAEAESCLQKAVYLQPDHVQALAHLALAAEWRGDAKAAELFRQRARRAEVK